ncbi:MAG: response regulator [Gemmatimonadota bacterium]
MTLVDTSAWIAFLRATGSEADHAVERLLAERARVFTTDTVVAELLAGAADEESARHLGRFLSSVDRCPPAGPLDLERAAYLYRSCRDAGTPVSSLSVCLLAAIAVRDDLEVLADDIDLEVLARRSDLRLARASPPPSQPTRASSTPAPTPPEPATPAPATSAVPEASLGRPSTVDTPPAPRPSLVLVLEDEPSAARMLEGALSRPDRRMVLATTAKEARSLIAAETPDAIVLDLVLPDEDGRNVLTELRRDPKTKNTGVVVVTGRAGPRTREECFALGADDFFDKPFEADALSSAVELVLSEGRSRAPAPDPLNAPLTLSEVQKLLSAQRREASGDHPWTVALIEVDAPLGGESEPPLLPGLLRSVIADLVPKLQKGELIARWGVDQLVVVSPDRAERALAVLVQDLSELPGVAKSLYGRVRRVGRDEDLLDAVSQMASNLAEETSPTGPEIEVETTQARTRPHATLVEDDPVTAGLVRHRLERSGFLVDHYTDGAQALDGILATPPNVVILDVQLPSMDGFEILGRMKEDPAARTVPVLMFTSLGRQEHVSRGFELGADDYVTKPFSPSELLTRVLRLVRKR